MENGEKWLLPDGVDELRPPYARQLELMRREVLDYFHCCGYQQVSPALIEYIESLSVGVGQELSLQTFKVIDQLNGRLLGIRADITPQVARIAATQSVDAASSLQDNNAISRPASLGISRFCYSEPILHATPSHLMASRTLLQTGAEIYGHRGLESDYEILRLMVETLKRAMPAKQLPLTIGIGHVGIMEGLLGELRLPEETSKALASIIHRKAVPELNQLIIELTNDPAFGEVTDKLNRLELLIQLHGGESVIQDALNQLTDAPEQVKECILTMRQIAAKLQQEFPGVEIYYDLSDFRGYNYYTGLVFAAYVTGFSGPVAKGGRYDGVGRDFGSARAATGFSLDLLQIAKAELATAPECQELIYASSEVPLETIHALRDQGRCVVIGLTGLPEEKRQLNCSHQLIFNADNWLVESL